MSIFKKTKEVKIEEIVTVTTLNVFNEHIERINFPLVKLSTVRLMAGIGLSSKA